METRLHSRRGKKSAPLLFYMPGPDDRTLARPEDPHFVECPEPHAEIVRTGQLFHVFIKSVYVDTYLSPAISNLYLSQIEAAPGPKARLLLGV